MVRIEHARVLRPEEEAWPLVAELARPETPHAATSARRRRANAGTPPAPLVPPRQAAPGPAPSAPQARRGTAPGHCAACDAAAPRAARTGGRAAAPRMAGGVGPRPPAPAPSVAEVESAMARARAARNAYDTNRMARLAELAERYRRRFPELYSESRESFLRAQLHQPVRQTRRVFLRHFIQSAEARALADHEPREEPLPTPRPLADALSHYLSLYRLLWRARRRLAPVLWARCLAQVPSTSQAAHRRFVRVWNRSAHAAPRRAAARAAGGEVAAAATEPTRRSSRLEQRAARHALAASPASAGETAATPMPPLPLPIDAAPSR